MSVLLLVPQHENSKSTFLPSRTTKVSNTKEQRFGTRISRETSTTQQGFVPLSEFNLNSTLLKTRNKLSDEELIHAITQEGRSDLFGQLYDRYANKVYRKCIGFSKDHDIAQDMVQDIFLKVFFQLPKFQGKSRFSTWLYTISYNFCVEYYRRNSKHSFVDIENQPDAIDESADEKELLKTRTDKLQKALEHIAPEDRAILLMKYQDQIPIKEIMDGLDISESAVKMRLARARQRAKEVIDQMED